MQVIVKYQWCLKVHFVYSTIMYVMGNDIFCWYANKLDLTCLREEVNQAINAHIFSKTLFKLLNIKKLQMNLKAERLTVSPIMFFPSNCYHISSTTPTWSRFHKQTKAITMLNLTEFMQSIEQLFWQCCLIGSTYFA